MLSEDSPPLENVTPSGGHSKESVNPRTPRSSNKETLVLDAQFSNEYSE